jgi:hypothetical protein
VCPSGKYADCNRYITLMDALHNPFSGMGFLSHTIKLLLAIMAEFWCLASQFNCRGVH